MSALTMATPATLTGERIELDIFQKAICLSVELGALGSKRKVNTSQVDVDADKALISVSKTLLESPELLAIKGLHTTVRQYLYRLTLRPDIFRSGIYVLPLVLVEEVDQQLTDYRNQLNDLVSRFLDKYEDLKARDKERLRAVYNERDYPAPSKVQESCYIEWSYIAFGVPDSLPGAIFDRERDKAASKIAEAADQIQQLLRAEMLDLVSHMADRLDSGKDGKPKIFRDTLVTNIKDFLKVFEARNLTDDAQLDALCRRARALLDGVDPQVLRDKSDLRERVRQGFSEIKQQLDGMVIDKPRRRIDLEEEK